MWGGSWHDAEAFCAAASAAAALAPRSKDGADAALLWARLKNKIKWCRRRPAEAGQPGLPDDIAQPRFAGLSSKSQTHLLSKRGWRAHDGRGGIIDPTDRVEIILEPIVGKRLYDHAGAVVLDGFTHMSESAHRISHVVQTIEEADQIVTPGWERLATVHFETKAPREAGLFGVLSRRKHGSFMVIEAIKS